MDLSKPIRDFMTSSLFTVGPRDSLRSVDEIFRTHRIHHIPVVRFRAIDGLISKSDFLHYKRGICHSKYEEVLEDNRLDHYFAEDIMISELVTLSPDDPLSLAVEIFRENLFHAIPITQNGELLGILTTFDILKLLSVEQ